MDLKEEQILGSDIVDHWYYVSKGRALRDFLTENRVLGANPVDVLDVGAGSGVFSRQLLESGICSAATCVDIEYPNDRHESHCGRPIDFVRTVDSVPQRLVLMMDVLEHVDDDLGMLSSYVRMMPKDGTIAITVPAMQFLWSGHDVFLEHHRRYTLSQLEAIVRKANLEIIDSRYFFGLLFPAVAMIRLVNRLRHAAGTMKPTTAMKKYPPLMNSALLAVHNLERKLLFCHNRLAGLTVFCLAKPRS